MISTFTVTIDGELSEKEAEKIRHALQKSVAPWFKKGHTVKVESE